MQQIISLHLVAVGAGVAWLTRHSRTVKQGKSSPKLADADATANAGSTEADLERSATQWLARNGPGGLHSSLNSDSAGLSSYAELELLAEGDLVYLRSDGNVLTALIPAARRLELQPLQLTKGKNDAVPTAPLEPTSVWVVRRWKQQVAFELHGPHNRRHVLEADPDAPHGAALGGWNTGRRGRWLITPKGLASARWQEHVLPLQVVPVQLLDARALATVKGSLGKKLADVTAKLEEESRLRTAVETQRDQLEEELRVAKDAAAAQASELRSQVDAAVRARHAAERDVSALQGQKADEAMRTKMAQARATQAEHELQQSEATVRRQQQQIQGMLAGHAEELRTLQQELQIAREANDGLKRAMTEQVMSLQGALELRDARILELEEENDRMDTVLQVIQTQLGGATGFGLPDRATGSGRPTQDSQPTGAGLGPDGGREADEAELSLSEMVRPGGAAAAGGEEPPLWRSLLDLTGDLTLTALKESLAISRRNTSDAAAQAETPVAAAPAAQPFAPLSPAETSFAVAQGPQSAEGTAPPDLVMKASHSPAALEASGPQPASPDGGSSVGSTAGPGAAGAAGWSSSSGGGGAAGSGSFVLGGEEGEFVSAAERMSGVLRPSCGGEATAGAAPFGHQPQQVSGAAGRGVGCGASAAEQVEVAVVGAAGAERPGVTIGGIVGLESLPPIATTPPSAAPIASTATANAAPGPASGTPRSIGGAFSTPQAAAVAAAASTLTGPAPGCSPAQLEYGLEATLTLDSLRRRMRELEAERDRLELLRTSLEETLPWRTSAAGSLAAEGSSRTVGAAAVWVRACGAEVSAAASAGGAEGSGLAAEEGVGAVRGSGEGDRGKRAGEDVEWLPGREETGRGGENSGRDVGQGVSGVVGRVEEDAKVEGAPSVCREKGEGTAGDQARHVLGPETSCSDADTVQKDKKPAAGEEGKGEAQSSPQQQQQQPQQRVRPLTQQERRKLRRGTASRQQSPAGASPGSPAVSDRPHSTAGAAPTGSDSPHGSPSGRVRRIAQQLFGGSGGGAASNASSSPAGKSRLTPRGGSTGGAVGASSRGASSVGGAAAGAIAAAAAASGRNGGATGVNADGSPPDTARVRSDDRALPEASRGPVAAKAEPVGGSGGASANTAPSAPTAPGGPFRLPELRIDPGRGTAHAEEEAFGVHDSIDAMCNLGSTRAMPTYRGNPLLTARRVGGHTRQPSASAVDAGIAADGFRSPARPMAHQGALSHEPVATTPTATATTTGGAAAAVGAGPATPKSLVSTPGGGTDVGADDDAAVHCDDQELSPPPGMMLLGSLEQLRSAAASSLSAAGGAPGGGRLSAFDEDEEDE